MTVILLCLAAYFGYLIGRRWERGEAEALLDSLAEQRFERSQRRGTLQLTEIRFRR